MGISSEAFRFVDLFAGLGGFHVALDELEGRGVFAAEWEPTLRALYKVNFGYRRLVEACRLAAQACGCSPSASAGLRT